MRRQGNGRNIPWVRYDEHPAENDWPGGVRYGMSRVVVHIERKWTVSEVMWANYLDITLPAMCRSVYESWFDQPHNTMMKPRRITAEFWVDDADNPKQYFETDPAEIIHAKEYGQRYWIEDPLAGVRKLMDNHDHPSMVFHFI